MECLYIWLYEYLVYNIYIYIYIYIYTYYKPKFQISNSKCTAGAM